MNSQVSRILFGMFLVLVAVSPVWFQQAALSGTVQDTSGAVLPGASVKLTSKAQGTVREILTNEAGVYQFSFLPPGAYDLEIRIVRIPNPHQGGPDVGRGTECTA